jgi:hypothetical protein
MFPEADLVISGHVHERTYVTHTGTIANQAGNIIRREQHHVGIPGYKDEWGKGTGGFGVEKLSPKPLGGYWFEIRRNWNKGGQPVIRQQFTD